MLMRGQCADDGDVGNDRDTEDHDDDYEDNACNFCICN